MMDNRHDHIDQLFQQGIESYEPIPSPGVWKGVSRNLSWNEFVKFDFSNFTHNIFLMAGSAASVVAIVVGSFLIWNDPGQTNPVATHQIVVTQTTEATTIASDTEIPATEPSTPTTDQPKQPVNTVKKMVAATSKKDDAAPMITAHIEENRTSISFLTPKPPSQIPNDDTMKGDFWTRNWDKIAGLDGFYRYPGKFSVGIATGFDHFVQPMGEKIDPTITNSTSAQLRLRYDNYGFQVETGLIINKWDDEGLYKANYKEWDTVYSYIRVDYFVPDPTNPDSVVLITETVYVYDSVAKQATLSATNKYTYLTIPLQFGYKLVDYGRFGLTAWVGGAISFESSRQIGSPTIPSGPWVGKVAQTDMTQPRKTQLFMYSAGLRFDVMLSKRIQFELEPYYRAYRTSVYTDGNFAKPHSLGVNTGISVKF